VAAVSERPLMALDRVTVALAMTAPVGSMTVPEMVPALPADWTREGAGRRCEETCAWARGAATESDVARMTNAAEMPRRLDVFMEFPLFGLPVAFLTRCCAGTLVNRRAGGG